MELDLQQVEIMDQLTLAVAVDLAEDQELVTIQVAVDLVLS